MLNFLVFCLISFLKQIIYLVVFTLIEPFYGLDMRFLIPCFCLILYLYMYFRYSAKISNYIKISRIRFDLYYSFSWILAGLFISYLMFKTKLGDYLPTGNGMFSGIEYLLVPVSLCIYLFVLIFIRIIIWIIFMIKNTKK